MSLKDLLAARGYAFRQHLEEEGWGWRKLTVVDLTDEQRAAFERGGEAGLKALLDAQGLWCFPAMDIAAPLPRQGEMALARAGRAEAVVVAPREGSLREMAQEFVKALRECHGVELTLLDDDTDDAGLKGRNVILFGGSHENRAALAMALRYQTFFADAAVPGDDGWLVATHAGLEASGRRVAQITASSANRAAAMACLLGGIVVKGADVSLRPTHRVEAGKLMRAHFPSWERFTASLPALINQLKGQSVTVPQDPAALAQLLAVGLDSGGFEKSIYNVAPVDIAVRAARYYQMTADPRALALFRELLFVLMDYYLKTPGGASYPSDIDFYLGHLTLYYARLEHELIFSDEDRLLLANLLLACTRSIHEYACKQWPITREARTRHNHETFPARSLTYASEYFARYGIAETARWNEYVATAFSGPCWRRSKHKENANKYEQFVFTHAIEHCAFTGKGLSLFSEGCLRRVVERQIIATDNFLRCVDYGDARPDTHPIDAMLPRLLAAYDESPVVRWCATEGFARKPEYLAGPITDIPGLRLRHVATPPQAGDWEIAPVDPDFLQDFAPGFPASYAFDKLAFRTGWNDDAHYLLFEGVGNMKVSHAHLELNGIARINQLGRHWIVSNGYGRLAGVTNVSKSFSSRVRGPEDHNMLVLRRGGEIVRVAPAQCALLHHARSGRLLAATGLLAHYGGTHWFRTLMVLADGYVLVLDRVRVAEPGLEAAHVEWNGLGEATARPDGMRLEQKGVFMDIASPSGWRAETSIADRSICWKNLLDSGSYPYASFPLKKLRYHMPATEAGRTACLTTLLSATRGAARFSVTQSGPGEIVVIGPHEGAEGARLTDGDLEVRVTADRCAVRFAVEPEVPAAIVAWTPPLEEKKK